MNPKTMKSEEMPGLTPATGRSGQTRTEKRDTATSPAGASASVTNTAGENVKTITVKLRHELHWVTRFEIPARCPVCNSEVKGFEAHEPALGRVFYDEEGVCCGSENADYMDDVAYRVACSKCGSSFADASETFVEFDVIERLKKLLTSDTMTVEGHAIAKLLFGEG